jgi:ABC-type Mn2+/Zn2+ transport system ATPase subunit
MEIIKAQKLNIYIQNSLFLKNVDLTISEGQIIHLVGKNGGGKTTLIEALLMLNNHNDGELKSNLNDEYGYLPQVSHQFPKIQKNVNFR